mmetsp:Transcript_20552/g.57024  ORF Transcript_20552/g.57024 Transcript_20552/m.57024 type:complete len:263 (+) Transcript_20552:1664-2452(+)
MQHRGGRRGRDEARRGRCRPVLFGPGRRPDQHSRHCAGVLRAKHFRRGGHVAGDPGPPGAPRRLSVVPHGGPGGDHWNEQRAGRILAALVGGAAPQAVVVLRDRFAGLCGGHGKPRYRHSPTQKRRQQRIVEPRCHSARHETVEFVVVVVVVRASDIVWGRHLGWRPRGGSLVAQGSQPVVREPVPGGVCPPRYFRLHRRRRGQSVPSRVALAGNPHRHGQQHRDFRQQGNQGRNPGRRIGARQALRPVPPRGDGLRWAPRH